MKKCLYLDFFYGKEWTIVKCSKTERRANGKYFTDRKQRTKTKLIFDKTGYTANLIFKEDGTEIDKDKVLKLLQRDIENEK